MGISSKALLIELLCLLVGLQSNASCSAPCERCVEGQETKEEAEGVDCERLLKGSQRNFSARAFFML